MKNYQRLLLLLFILLLSGYFFNKTFAQKKGIKWDGKIEYENGIKVIKNPENPVYGKIKFDLVEDLSIGNEENENYMFYSLTSLAVDDKGNVYVLDSGNCRVQKFDSKGNYIKTIGRKGQGPGEFERPERIFVDEKNIYVLEFMKIHIFDLEGNFVRTIKTGFFVDSFIMGNKKILAFTTLARKDKQIDAIILLNLKGRIIKEIVSFPNPLRLIRKGGTIFMAYNPYQPRLYFSLLREGKGVYGYSSKYKLFVINSEGKVEFIFEKTKTPSRITRKEKNKIINDFLESRNKWLKKRGFKLSKGDAKEAFVFPKHRPFFNDIMGDNLNNIYIKKLTSVLKKEKAITFDLFNSKGFYLYEIKIPEEPEIIGNGYIYTYIVDEAGYFKIKRYKIRNWDNIKKLSTFSLQD